VLKLGYPFVLAAAPAVVALLYLLARRGDRELPRSRRIAALGVRTLGALALILAMAAPSATRPLPRPPCVVFAVDVSESVGDRALDEAAARIEEAAARVHAAGGSTALVAFAGRAVVLRPPDRAPLAVDRERLLWRRTESELRAAAERGDAGSADRLARLAAWRESLDVLSTDLSAAAFAATSLFLPHADGRAVIVTDGREPVATRPPSDPRVAWLQIPPSRRRDLAVIRLGAPPVARHGEPFDLDVEVEASHAGEVTLGLTVDDQARSVAVERFRLGAPGRYTLTLDAPQALRSLEPGLHRLLVMASQDGEEEPRNNQAFAAVTVVGRPEVLLVEGGPYEGEGLARALAAQEIAVKRVAADQLGTRIDDLGRYAAVALAGVAPTALRSSDAAALREYVENGGGLLVLGTSRWTSIDGFDRADLAPLLPVDWVPETKPPTTDPSTPTPKPPTTGGRAETKRVLAPTVALLLAIDKSGSMAGRNIELAREACIGAAETLSENDFVGVLAFDVKAHWVVEWTRADSRDFITKQLLRLHASGGTNIHPALVEAERTFRADPRAATAGVRHMILLSDGITPAANFEEPIAALRRNGVTITSVCIGSAEYDGLLMNQFARLGGGRFLFTGDFKNVPKIFTQETKFIIKESAKEIESRDPPVQPPPVEPPSDTTPRPAPARRTIAVRSTGEHEATKGIGPRDLPSLQGAAGARARKGAAVPLAGAGDEPVLAVWRFGLGKCAVWTSDLGGPWSQEWAAYAGTPRLFAQLVRHLSSAAEDGDLGSRVGVTRENDRIVVRVDSVPNRDTLELHRLSPRRERIEFGPVADGCRTAAVAVDGPGVLHHLSLVRRGEPEERFALAAMMAYPAELASPSMQPAFAQVPAAPRPLADLDRIVPPPPVSADVPTELALWCLLAALVLLPIDVALRRLR